MKRKDIYALLTINAAIIVGFFLITGLIYIKKTNQINKIKFETKRNVIISDIRNLHDQYEFITSEDTFYVSKENQPNLNLEAIEETDPDESFTIKYTSTELVALKNNNQIFFEFDLVKTKKEARDAFALEAFYWCITICCILFFGTIILTKLNENTINKVQKNILLIPDATKVREQLFQHSYREINFLLLHICTSKRNIIRVYIPIDAENLVRPNNMHTEKIDGRPYCYFDYTLFTSKVDAAKLQAKIDSKFENVV